ncbi:chaperone modulator CbpM [Legionella sp. CNM-4043-24]|uniref:chaperone modulator CbpM n=1 Tax=Legionella sp. CNM-4043-24 TaxID=3421646 RepID=UPI00403A9A5A
MTAEKHTSPESEEWFYLSLQEVTRSFGVPTDTIMEIIDEGIVSVHVNEKNELQFDTHAIHSIRTTLRLHQDLGVNMAGAALALELLREIERLKALLRR